MIDRVIISCEHGGYRVPARYRSLLAGAGRILTSHRGYDRGALPLARRLARATHAPLHAAQITRLLVDLNRSLSHPNLFSPRIRALGADERQRIIERHYRPHRQTIEESVADAIERGQTVLHLGVHTFTPVRNGQRRRADIGLLYDPARALERQIAGQWHALLNATEPRFSVRRNYPYRGAADGLTTHLRRRFSPQRYVGIELELNQRHARKERPPIMTALVRTFQQLIGEISR